MGGVGVRTIRSRAILLHRVLRDVDVGWGGGGWMGSGHITIAGRVGHALQMDQNVVCCGQWLMPGSSRDHNRTGCGISSKI